jgi:hypothetical protein
LNRLIEVKVEWKTKYLKFLFFYSFL